MQFECFGKIRTLGTRKVKDKKVKTNPFLSLEINYEIPNNHKMQIPTSNKTNSCSDSSFRFTHALLISSDM